MHAYDWVLLIDMFFPSNSPGACQVVDSDERVTVQFAFMTAISAQSGTHKPEQVFCLAHVASDEQLDTSGGDSFTGLLLQLSTCEHVEPTGTIYLPRQPEKFGALKMFTTDSFVEYLLDMPTRTDPSREVSKVHISVLLFDDWLPSVVQIVGVDCSFGDFHSGDSAFAALADPTHADVLVDDDHLMLEDVVGSSSSGAGAAEAVSDGNPSEEVGVDLLSFLESETVVEEKPQKRRKKNIENHKNDDVQNEKGTGSLLDDPSLGTFLDSSQLAAFREIEQLCSEVHATDDIYERRARLTSNTAVLSDSEEDAEVEAADIAEGPKSAGAPAGSSKRSTVRKRGYFSEFQESWFVFVTQLLVNCRFHVV